MTNPRTTTARAAVDQALTAAKARDLNGVDKAILDLHATDPQAAELALSTLEELARRSQS